MTTKAWHLSNIVRKKSRAVFRWRIVRTKNSHRFIVVEDLYNDNNKSNFHTVTNDIEGVIADICSYRSDIKASMPVVYKDTEGNWDAWNGKRFIFLGTKTDDDAIAEYEKRYNGEWSTRHPNPMKEKFENELIPALNKMIIKERDHLEMLESAYERSPSPYINDYIATSKKELADLEARLQEYNEYVEQLN